MLTSEFIASDIKDSPFLMFVLHGLGDSMEGYREIPQWMRCPWLNYVLVNAPDSYFGGYSWYDFEGDPAPGIQRSCELLLKLVASYEEKGFSLKHQFLFGFSQGCLLTVEVGIRTPGIMAGLVGISGYIHQPKELWAQRSAVALQQHFLITHGTRDPLIDSSQVKTQVDWLQSQGANIQWKIFDKEHTIAGEEEISWIRQFLEKRKSEIIEG